jgi:hypothetical protein
LVADEGWNLVEGGTRCFGCVCLELKFGSREESTVECQSIIDSGLTAASSTHDCDILQRRCWNLNVIAIVECLVKTCRDWILMGNPEWFSSTQGCKDLSLKEGSTCFSNHLLEYNASKTVDPGVVEKAVSECANRFQEAHCACGFFLRKQQLLTRLVLVAFLSC